MPDIIKTWPAMMDRKKLMRVFTFAWGNFYFSVGRGKPQRPIENLWYAHVGEILGHFKIGELVFNENERTLPRLRSLDNKESQWQFRPGIWVAVCPAPFIALKTETPIYHESFRGWRYFDFDEYKASPGALISV